jgi:hypothetical protein
MDIPAILGTIAEIVITMAGFMGVIVAFNTKGIRAEETYYRIQWTFALSLVVIMALLSPHFLIGLSGSPAIVFGVPLAFFGIALALLVCLGLWQQATGKTSRTGSIYLRAMFLLITGVVLVALILSAFDVLIPRLPEMLVLGSIWSICLIAFGFVSSVWQGTVSSEA